MREPRDNPLYCYLMRSPGSGVPSHVGIASNPVQRVHAHNRVPGYGPACKGTRRGAPNWQLCVIVGPIYRGAAQFAKEWRQHSRTDTGRILHGVLKAKTNGLNIAVWNRDEVRKLLKKRRKACKDALSRGRVEGIVGGRWPDH